MTAAPETATTTDDASPPALWAAARELLLWLVAQFGRSADIAALGTLAPKEHREILAWLRPLEALARALLLVEAAAALAPASSPRRSSARRQPRRRRLFAQDPDDVGAWRVSFRACPAPVAPLESLKPLQPLGLLGVPRNTLRDAWPLAERVEAVSRVLDDPAPFAARLARRLHGRPDRAIRLARPARPHPDHPNLGRWALGKAAEHAQRAAAVYLEPGRLAPTFCDTS